MSWSPQFTLDLQAASTNAFIKVLEDFEAWRQTQEPRPLDLANGWKEVNPETAEGMLLRNPIGANRRPTLQTVKFYARQMLGGAWKKTGQPIIFDDLGALKDAGHRLWASYLSGASFPTFLVGDVPHDDALFAYIDGGKIRTTADALATAGLDGQAKHIAQVVNVAMHFDNGLYTASSKKKLEKVTSIEVIEYVRANDNLRNAARLMAGEHKSATAIIHYKEMATFAASKILDLHGEETLDTFMAELGQLDGDEAEGSPIAAFQKVMEEDQRAREPMSKHQVLGHLIKCFNSWLLDEQVRKLTLRVNETFPRFVGPQPTQQAAE